MTRRELAAIRNGKSIEEYITSSIDETIGEMLGQSVIDSLHVHLAELGIPWKKPQVKVRLFSSLLDSTFGIQSTVIQRDIARKLYAKLGLFFTVDEGKGLADYVAEAKEAMLNGKA
ncbi:MAG TPA: hypothetical protein VLV31_03185 [Candidatus Acidoferrales bacterium]|nr:hypothetical protein [Candidatus Acidoferrales bacterium]